MELRTWSLSPEALDAAVIKLGKINQKATKRGLGGRYTYRTGETTSKPVYDDTGCSAVVNGVPSRVEKGQLVPCPLLGFAQETELIVEGDAPCLAGWRFLAVLTWDAGVFVARTVPGFDGIIAAADFPAGACDHCHKIRRRNDTYVVENTEGQRKQVGSNCIKDFLGHPFAPSMLRDDDLDEMEQDFAGGRYDVAWTAQTVIARAVSVIHEFGFVSRAKSQETYGTATADLVRDALDARSQAARELEARTRPGDTEYAAADTIIAWVASQDGSSQYMINLQSVCAGSAVSMRNVGIAASAVAAYNKATQERIERETRPVSQYQGSVKQRGIWTLTIRREIPIEGDFGTSYLYLMTDATGNAFKWFSSRWQKGWEPGLTVTLKGTVKGHEDYKDVKYTVLTRCTAQGEPVELADPRADELVVAR